MSETPITYQFSEGEEIKTRKVRLTSELPLYSDKPIHSIEDAINVIREDIGLADREYLYSLNLDEHNQPLNASIISVGTQDSSLTNKREAFKASVLSNASKVMFFHNHPNGYLSASQSDLYTTKQLSVLGASLGIEVLDHIILTDKDHYSIREHYPEQFTDNIRKNINDIVLEDQFKTKSNSHELKRVSTRLTDQNLLMNQKIISADVMKELAKDIVKVNSSKNDMLYTIYMNGHNQPINIMQADYSDMNIHDFQTLQQKIVLHGIENSAANMILVHNGSHEIDSTFLHHTCYNAGLANMPILDCIEVNGNTSYSLREKGETIFSSSNSNEMYNNETNLDATEHYVNHLMVNEQKATYKTKKNYKRTSEQEKNARVKEASERVLKQVDDFIVNPKLVIDYIKWKKQFPSYSFNNTLLIYSQNSRATAVGSYSMWKEKGVAVKRGEKGMKIFAPIIVKELLDKEKKVVTTLGKASKKQKELLKMGVLTEKDRVASYTTTSVFDIAQTTATLDMYPEIVKRGYEKESDIDFSKYNHALHTVMEEHHITFTDDNLNNSYQTLGYCIPTENKIFLQSNLSNVARFKTLTHELAHGLLHKNTILSDKEREFQAQMVSNVVSEVLGVPMKEYDISYVKLWSESLTPENKKALMKGVIDTADLMLDSYDNTLEAFKTNKLTMKEKEVAKQLEIIDNPAFSINDIKEITHYPASEKLTASYTRDKIINKRAKLTADEELKFNEDNMLFLRKKVVDNEHVFYHIDDVTELMIATSQRKNEVEFNYYSVTGEITSQEVAGLDDAIKILHQKGAIPVSEKAMEYKKLADKNMERDRTLIKQRNQIKQTTKENTLERTLERT